MRKLVFGPGPNFSMDVISLLSRLISNTYFLVDISFDNTVE